MENNAITTIVELLFGEQMRNYEKRFGKLQETQKENQESTAVSLGQLHQDMMQQLSNLEHRLSAQIAKNHEDLLARLDQIDEQKLDRRQLGKMLVEIGNQISA